MKQLSILRIWKASDDTLLSLVFIRERKDKKVTLTPLTFKGNQVFALELPFVNNEPNISAIPGGNYPAFMRRASTIQLQDVPNRTAIQIHPMNQVKDGKSEGCIAMGYKPTPKADCSLWLNDTAATINYASTMFNLNDGVFVGYFDGNLRSLGSCDGLLSGMEPTTWLNKVIGPITQPFIDGYNLLSRNVLLFALIGVYALITLNQK